MKSITLLLLAFSLNCYGQTAEEYFKSGNVKDDLKDYRGAIQDYSKGLELNPKNTDYYYIRGIIKRKLEEYRAAIIDFNQAIDLNSKDASFYYNRGLAKIGFNQKNSGCLDLSKAGESGFDKAYEAIKKLCN